MSITNRAIGAAVLAALSGTAYGQSDAFWTNDNGGVWSTASSWSGGQVPNNQGEDLFNATLAQLSSPYTVSLDLDVTLQNLNVIGSDVTLDLFDGNMTVLEGMTIANATLVRQAKDPGNAITVIEGTLTLTDAMLMGAGELQANGGVVIGGTANTDICNTCVNNRNDAYLVGPGSLSLNQGGELMNGDGASFTIVADQNRTISGDGTGKIVNDGTINNAVTSRGSSGNTNISGVEFINNGTLNVFAGSVTLNTSNNLAPDQVLSQGTWNVFDGTSLAFGDSFFNKLDTEINISGSDAVVFNISSLNEVLENGKFGIFNGQDFTFTPTSGQFANRGEIEVGLGSVFNAGVQGLGNLDGSELYGGRYVIEGTFQTGANEITLLAADLTLIGADSVFTGIQALDTVATGGRFELAGGRNFSTLDDFEVQDGALVKIGAGSTFEITNQLVNNDGAGVFDAAAFDVQGTLIAQNLNILEISNELILDGLGSQLLDGAGNDAIANLQRIREDGILRLRNGRSLSNLDDLVVEGVLSIEGSGPGVSRGDVPGSVRVAGTATFVAGSTLEIIIDGAEAAMHGQLIAGMAVIEEDTTLALVVGDEAALRLGDEMVLVQAGDMTGVFTDIMSEGFGDGLSFEIFQNSQGVIARVVPAPGFGVTLMGLGLLAGRRRR